MQGSPADNPDRQDRAQRTPVIRQTIEMLDRSSGIHLNGGA